MLIAVLVISVPVLQKHVLAACQAVLAVLATADHQKSQPVLALVLMTTHVVQVNVTKQPVKIPADLIICYAIHLVNVRHLAVEQEHVVQLLPLIG